MASQYSNSVQVVLVFDNTQTFDRQFGDLARLENRLMTAIENFGPWKSLKGYNSPTHLGLGSDNRHITVQRFDAPLDMNGFADVLANPLNLNAKRDVVEAILAHQRCLLIEVSAGSVPGFAQALAQSGLGDLDMGAAGTSMGLNETQQSYEQRLLLAQTFSCALIQELMPSAVHWVQSQQVFDGPTFVNLAQGGFSIPLYAGAFLFGGEELPNGLVKAGVRALGSQYLLGKMVMFTPDTQDWAQSYTQMLAFIAYCRSIGRLLGDGETMSSDEPGAPVLRVTHKSDIPQLPEGYIELSLIQDAAAVLSGVPQQRGNEADIMAAMRGERPRGARASTAGAGAGILQRVFGRLSFRTICIAGALAYMFWTLATPDGLSLVSQILSIDEQVSYQLSAPVNIGSIHTLD